MKKIPILILAVASILFACKKDKVQTDLSRDQQYFEIFKKASLSYKGPADNRTTGLKPGNQVARPVKLFGTGSNSYIPGGCGAGTLQILSTASGNGTHLGNFTVSLTRCIDLNNGQIIGTIDGVGTAANGDKQYFRIVGVGVDPATGLYFEDYIYTGGTGRFVNCSGSFRNLFPVLTDDNFSFYGEGTITY